MQREYREIDDHGPVRLVAHGEGYAMVRRKGSMPFVISYTVWDFAPPAAASTEATHDRG